MRVISSRTISEGALGDARFSPLPPHDDQRLVQPVHGNVYDLREWHLDKTRLQAAVEEEDGHGQGHGDARANLREEAQEEQRGGDHH